MKISIRGVALCTGLLLVACDPGVSGESVREVDRSALKADSLPGISSTLSCQGHCGVVVFDSSGYCGCDAVCAAIKDCCADWQQICVAGCNYTDPKRKYYGKTPEKCAAMMFICDPGWKYFADNCGCGCEDNAPPPCNYTDPKRKYYGKTPEKCAAMMFICDPGWKYFADNCGCGCENRP